FIICPFNFDFVCLYAPFANRLPSRIGPGWKSGPSGPRYGFAKIRGFSPSVISYGPGRKLALPGWKSGPSGPRQHQPLNPVIPTDAKGAYATEAAWRDPDDASLTMPLQGVLTRTVSLLKWIWSECTPGLNALLLCDCYS